MAESGACMESKMDTTVQKGREDPGGQIQSGAGIAKYEDLPDEELILRMRSENPAFRII